MHLFSCIQLQVWYQSLFLDACCYPPTLLLLQCSSLSNVFNHCFYDVTVIKWWRSDKKCGKKDMFDVSSGEVLVVPAPDPTATEMMLKTECRVQKTYTVFTGSAVQDDDDDDEGEGWYTKTGRKRKQKKVVEEKRAYKRRKVVLDPQGDGTSTSTSDKIGGKDSASSPTENRQRPKTAKLGRPRSLPIDGDNDSSVPPNAVLSVSGEEADHVEAALYRNK